MAIFIFSAYCTSFLWLRIDDCGIQFKYFKRINNVLYELVLHYLCGLMFYFLSPEPLNFHTIHTQLHTPAKRDICIIVLFYMCGIFPLHPTTHTLISWLHLMILVNICSRFNFQALAPVLSFTGIPSWCF